MNRFLTIILCICSQIMAVNAQTKDNADYILLETTRVVAQSADYITLRVRQEQVDVYMPLSEKGKVKTEVKHSEVTEFKDQKGAEELLRATPDMTQESLLDFSQLAACIAEYAEKTKDNPDNLSEGILRRFHAPDTLTLSVNQLMRMPEAERTRLLQGATLTTTTYLQDYTFRISEGQQLSVERLTDISTQYHYILQVGQEGAAYKGDVSETYFVENIKYISEYEKKGMQ